MELRVRTSRISSKARSSTSRTPTTTTTTATQNKVSSGHADVEITAPLGKLSLSNKPVRAYWYLGVARFFSLLAIYFVLIFVLLLFSQKRADVKQADVFLKNHPDDHALAPQEKAIAHLPVHVPGLVYVITTSGDQFSLAYTCLYRFMLHIQSP